jgi:hypothetical protein
MSVVVAPECVPPPKPPRTPPWMTVNAAGRVRVLPPQWAVMSYAPGLAFRWMTAVALDVVLFFSGRR